MKNKGLFFLYNILIVLILLSLLELGINFLLNNPSKIPQAFVPAFQNYYRQYDRAIIQVEPELAQYDSSLFYLLKPGTSVFANREFSNFYQINSFGLRDDSISLMAPEVITLGDSFTMGWGVDQNLSFSQLLEKKINMQVLNAGISSYGTARELKLLKGLNLNNLKYLIIQYHPSDYIENLEFYNNNNTIVISDQPTYDAVVERVSNQKEYYPGKYSSLVLKELIKSQVFKYSKDKVDYVEDEEREAFYFLNTLINSSIDFSEFQVLVLYLDSWNNYKSSFSESLKKEIKEEHYPGYIKDIKVIDVREIISDEDYFILDDHLNVQGHKKIADLLYKEIKRI